MFIDKQKSTIERYDTLLRNTIPIIGVKVQEYGVIMHIKYVVLMHIISQFAVRYPQKYISQGFSKGSGSIDVEDAGNFHKGSTIT